MVHRRRLIAGVVLGMVVAGCVAPPAPFVAGQRIATPPAWQDYCRRNPADPGCQP
jgi:hypothetical protein